MHIYSYLIHYIYVYYANLFYTLTSSRTTLCEYRACLQLWPTGELPIFASSACSNTDMFPSASASPRTGLIPTGIGSSRNRRMQKPASSWTSGIPSRVQPLDGGRWSLSERKRRMQKVRSSGMREMLACVQPWVAVKEVSLCLASKLVSQGHGYLMRTICRLFWKGLLKSHRCCCTEETIVK